MGIRYELANVSGYTITSKKVIVKLLKLLPSGYAPVRVRRNNMSRHLIAGEEYLVLNEFKLEYIQSPGKYR